MKDSSGSRNADDCLMKATRVARAIRTSSCVGEYEAEDLDGDCRSPICSFDEVVIEQLMLPWYGGCSGGDEIVVSVPKKHGLSSR